MTKHLEFHQHAFTDENNIVKVIAVFEESDHNTDLIEQIRIANNAKEAICCCTFGLTTINSTWTGSEFIPEKPFDSWQWNIELKVWEAPISMPDDDFYVWDESVKNWVVGYSL